MVVGEAGVSPLGSDHGTLPVPKTEPTSRMTVPGASDPHAVPRVRAAFGPEPNLVAGPEASPSAAIAFVRRPASVEALSLPEAEGRGPLRRVLVDRRSPKVPGR